MLGGFEVGDGAKIGSNAVVIKPVPAGATAVGIPARIIASKAGQSADVTEVAVAPQPAATAAASAASPAPFSAYGVEQQQDDPLAQAMRSLIEHTAVQERQIAMLWQSIEKLSNAAPKEVGDCVPCEAATSENFAKDKLNDLVGK